METKDINGGILTFIPALEKGGGAEKAAIEIDRELRREGFSTMFLTIYKNVDSHSDTKSLNYGNAWVKRKLKYVFGPFQLKQFCKNNNIKLVITHKEDANFIALISKLVGNRVRIATVSHGWHRENRPFNNELVVRILYRFADRNIAVSKRFAQEMKNKSIPHVEVIYNPIDVDEMKKRAEEDIPSSDEYLFTRGMYTFISVGRLHEQKGFSHLIEAFVEVARKYAETQLLVVGEGELREDLQRRIRNTGYEERIKLIGFRENVFPYLRASNCFVLSSLFEGLPTVLTEALVMRIPIIATDCLSGPRELLAPGCDTDEPILYPFKTETGYLIRPPLFAGGFKKDLVEAIEGVYLEEGKGEIRKNEYSNPYEKHWSRLAASFLS